MKPLSEKRDRRRHQRRSVRKFLIILFWGACSGPFLIRSLSAADSESPVPKHLWISGGDFFTENYYLEMQENGDLIYRTTKGDRGQLISEVTIHPTPDKWRD